MATTIESRNLALGPPDHPTDSNTSPSTPQTPHGGRSRSQPLQSLDESSQKTPPRVTFAENSNKRALPVSPLGSSFPSVSSTSQEDRAPSSQGDSQPSGKTSNGEDVEMDSDGEEGSDIESDNGESGRPSKKKKGQRFFCTEYPPCNLSFTRSEHLARHIRKHTGERPFQCHCSRRFSRLDNLRQHAQTVHVNEDIPAESLAATGTRFQRQIRTDRVRPPGRSRASTGGSTGSHSRGHGRNLSTSSITSTGSTMSTMSNLSSLSRDNSGRRPAPLMMAENSPHARLTIDTMKASPQGYNYGGQSPGGATTPTSVAYSNTPSSPFNPSLGSPMNTSRPTPAWGDRTPGRRLSVPSSANPFQPTSAGFQSPSFASHGPGHSRNSSASSIIASPTSSVFSYSRQDPTAEAEWRRRTWHPSTYTNYGYHQRPATSGLMYHQTPDAPRPAFAPQAAAAAAAVSQPHRLPGFETFDQISQRPMTPPRSTIANQPETPNSRQTTYPPIGERSGGSSMHDRRNHASWDMSLHQNLTKLDIANSTPPREASSSWGRSVLADIQSVSNTIPATASLQQPQQLQQPPQQEIDKTTPVPNPAQTVHARQPQTQPQTGTALPERSRRQGWYYGQFGAASLRAVGKRNSSEETSSSESVLTPLTAPVDYQPSIVHASGYIEPQSATTERFPAFPSHYTSSQHIPHTSHGSFDTTASGSMPKTHAMTGLEALVAVATSENKARDAMQVT